MPIQIYKKEIEDGLADNISTNNSIAYCCQVKPVEINNSNLMMFLSEASEKFDINMLYPTQSVFVTSSWNKNDDVFGSTEIWNARHTPVNKATNIDHNQHKIVGHITNTWVINEDGEVLPEDLDIEDLPEMIHICNGAVIYRHYKDDDLNEMAETLIEEIENGTKYVSMECLFPDFDYAIISPDDKKYIIRRGEETSFLTKHLKAYGGKGMFREYKVGRFIKDMVFSGKGYVDDPANPNSIIFSNEKPSISFSNYTYKNDLIIKNGVNSNMSKTSKMSTANLNLKESGMSETVDFYKAELQEVKKQLTDLIELNKGLEATIANSNVEQLKKEIENLTSKIEAMTKEKQEIVKSLSDTEASYKDAQVSLVTITESKQKLEEEIKKIEAQRVLSNRVNELIGAGMEKESAESTANKFSALNDEQFAEIVVFASNKTKTQADTNVDQLEEVLDDVKVDTSDDVGSAEDEDESESVGKVRQSIAKYFASALNVSTQDSDE